MALGQFVTGGVTHLLPQALGHQRAMELIVLGERLSGAALHALGLVNRVVPPDQVLPTALRIAPSGLAFSAGHFAAEETDDGAALVAR